MEELRNSQKKNEEAQLKIKQLHEINSNYTAELKIQKRISMKLKKEIEYTAAKTKDLESSLTAEKEQNEVHVHARRTLEEHLAQQQNEVRASQLVVDGLHKGFEY